MRRTLPLRERPHLRSNALTGLSRAHRSESPQPRKHPQQIRPKNTIRPLAQVKNSQFHSDVWFKSASPGLLPATPHEHLRNSDSTADERTLKLGKTIRTLQQRLPSLLASPLPQEVLSPQITLKLFPSTHPHLPSVSGRLPYSAALWTAPVAWGRVPVVGNVNLIILSERMVKHGSPDAVNGSEKLIVKWKTCGRKRLAHDGNSNSNGIPKFLGGDKPNDQEFCGLFIFEFDEQGRISVHTIEHAQEGNNFEKMTRVVSVTDWLLGLAKRRRIEEPELALGYCEPGHYDARKRERERERSGFG